MLTELRIQFETAFGQALQVLVGDVALDLEWLGDGWWGRVVDLPVGAGYHYRVVRDDEVIHEEQPSSRVVDHEASLVVDRWRWTSGAPYASALFTKALAARHCGPGEPGAGSASFFLTEPAVPAGATPAVVGASTALGEWDPAEAIPMASAGYPKWATAVNVEPVDVEYKYVLLAADGGLIEWEGGANRVLPAGDTRVVNDDRMAIAPFRAAGVAVPVFSLRTDHAVGCGEFSDLKPFADWAESVGLAVVQLLPVNDTVLNHDWDDSYPYNPISVHALHPLYCNVDAISGHGISNEISAARATFAAAAEVDYPAVMSTKMETASSCLQEPRTGPRERPRLRGVCRSSLGVARALFGLVPAARSVQRRRPRQVARL